jgi:hypothetical protein
MPNPISDFDEVNRDDHGRVRSVRHTMPSVAMSAAFGATRPPTARQLADEYVRQASGMFQFSTNMVSNLTEPVPVEPSAADGPQLRFQKEKKGADVVTVSYLHTQKGIPVWNSGMSVRVRVEPMEVIGVQNEVDYEAQEIAPLTAEGFLPQTLIPSKLVGLLGMKEDPGIRINRMGLVIYRYELDNRTDPQIREAEEGRRDTFSLKIPTIPLPPVSPDIQPGRYYVVTEVLFSLPWNRLPQLNWRAMIEPRTGSVLYLRALIASATGCVFASDPITKGHNVSSTDTDAVLNALRDTVNLEGLKPPASKQKLSGTFVELQDTELPSAIPPEESDPYKFEYPVRSSKFAAVNAYHHCDSMFRVLQGMGFNVQEYFDGTTFPVPVDHYSLIGGDEVNAAAPGNPNSDGSGGFLFGLANTGGPVGIATDPRVVWHEFGHALLWDHVNSPNFGFAHSAGDSLAAILFDPESRAADRFDTFPFMRRSAGLARRHDRKVAEGWAWGGEFDNKGYQSEQILSTTLFRIYQACGGDSADLAIKKWASRYVVYLIFRAISMLTMRTWTPDVFVDNLMDADRTTKAFEGLPGGLLGKGIRWSFEQQGLYQTSPNPSNVTKPGNPPPVDVYIDDGRNGDYMPFLPDGGRTTEIWNRLKKDGQTKHQPPAGGKTNYLYARIANRGTRPAVNIVARAFQSSQPKTAKWPGGWTSLTTPSVRVLGPIPSKGEIIAGPFSWKPSRGGNGVLITVDADGDLSLVGEIRKPVDTWLLALLDNNIGVRAF